MEDRNLVTEEQQMQEQPVVQDKYCGYPMKWYKWLIYFVLFVTALSCLGNAGMYLTGDMYRQAGGSAQMVYSRFPAMQTVDILMGVLCVAQLVVALMARWKLAGLKADGPKYLYAVYVFTLIENVIYAAGSAMALAEPITAVIDVGSFIGTLLGAGLMLWLNKIYFTKRKALFVN